MIRNPKLLEEVEIEDLKKEKTDYFKALRIFESLWNEGVNLGVLPLKDPLEDIDTDIKIARILNSKNV
jgi:hypothetical protein